MTDLLALAKDHFQYKRNTPDCSIPKTYLKELEAHLNAYAFDRNFTIKRQPRVGYGILTCLEEGCKNEIALTPLEGERDGGKRIGVGSLSAYRDHIEKHPAHKKGVQTRVQSRNGPSATPLVARGTGAVASPSRVLKPVDAEINRRASARFATDMDASVVPAKRYSDSAFTDPPYGVKVKQEEEDASPPSAKKARLDGADSKLALATNRATANRTSSLLAPAHSGADIDDLNEQYRDVLAEISHLEPIHDRAVRKKHKTKGEETRILTYKDQLDKLKRKRDQLKAQIASQSSRPIVRAEVKPSVVAQPPPRSLTLQPGSSAGHAMAASGASSTLPSAATPSPWGTFVEQHQQRHGLPALTNAQRAALAARQQQRAAAPFPMKIEQPSTSLNAAVSVKREQGNAVASGSGLTRAQPSPPKAIVKTEAKAVTLVKREIVEQRINPVASSSRLPALPTQASAGLKSSPQNTSISALLTAKFEDSDDSDSDSDIDYSHLLARAPGEDIARRLLERAGVDVPPPIHDARDEEGLFFGRGRDNYEGPRAGHGDIDQFLKLAGNAETFDKSASVVESLAKLGLKDLEGVLPGMEIALMAHQVIGVSWMVEREASILKGGCLADDMGLGKTVQMMSLIVKNRSKDPKNKINLILAPLALLDQWKYEIETKTNCDLKVLIYHGASRPRRKRDLQEYDVVLTTYNTMAMEWPDFENEAKKKEKARRQKKREGSFIVDDSDDETLAKKVSRRKETSGLLFQMEFYRIILDEAQNIRNRRTRVSRAVSELTATYRWCLTGTPIINGLSDTYAYMRFLKLRPWYDWAEFNDHIALREKKNPALAVSKLQAILATYQLRRTKQSELDGKKLIELPEKKIEVTALHFTEEEADIYKMVEAKSQATFNRFLRAGTVLKNYHQVLVLLLRLRQICSHPCLIQEEVAAFVGADEDANVKAEVASEVSRAVKLLSQQWVDEVKRRLRDSMIARMEAEKESPDAALEGEECPICFDVMNETCVLTACKHAFCKECIVGVLDNPSAEVDAGADKNKEQRPCPVCRAAVDRKLLFTRAAFEPRDKELNPNAADNETEEEDSDIDEDEMPASRKGKGRAVKHARGAYRGMDEDDYEDDDDEDLSDFIVEDDEDEEEKDARRDTKRALKKKLGKRRANVILDSDEEDEMETAEVQGVLFGAKSKAQLEAEAMEKMPRFLPSTKMKYMMQLIVKKFKENPEEKILVISQWTSCLSLVSDYLTEKGIGHVKYQGDMNRDKRDAAVRVFMSKQKAKIMLMSLKCGGVGLNLTRANNVISLDLAWSRAVESQAWDRVHRLGQKLPVKVDRLVIADTVEDRIMALQERKQSLADGSLGEGKGKKIGKLTVKELANLFGLDGRGRRLHD